MRSGGWSDNSYLIKATEAETGYSITKQEREIIHG